MVQSDFRISHDLAAVCTEADRGHGAIGPVMQVDGLVTFGRS